ncbi:MAG: GNAT family N-acetyltransferase [Porcipelethomonas sp.]
MIIIREVKTDDEIAATAALAEEIWHQHFTPIIGADQVKYMISKFQSAEAIKKQIMTQGYTYLNAFEGDERTGYTGFCRDGNRMFLSKLYVRKEHRGKGISRLMLNDIIKRSEGLEGIYLTVNKHNDRTIEIYKHMGFRMIDKAVTDIGCGFVMDDYIFQLDI